MLTIYKNLPAKYIIASSKEWNKQYFNRLKGIIPGDWHWISSPSDLVTVLKDIKPRYIFFLHWNWLVPEDVWKNVECVCFHMTDVPFGRGGSPLQNLILAGHTDTKLTALRIVKELDAGPVYAKKSLSLDGRAEEIYLRMGNLSSEIIQWMIENNPEPKPQEGEVVIFKRRKPEQSNLPREGDLRNAYNFIRMLDADGYPNAFVEYGSYQMHFQNARLDSDHIIAEVVIKSNNQT